ncbi:hypothetical protein C7T35_37955 [Variovorax sp. WS11]|nr:hypothetical protein C7T35_37955 [Variovorax sp. WS11]
MGWAVVMHLDASRGTTAVEAVAQTTPIGPGVDILHDMLHACGAHWETQVTEHPSFKTFTLQ